jgi:hypothetical protein
MALALDDPDRATGLATISERATRQLICIRRQAFITPYSSRELRKEFMAVEKPNFLEAGMRNTLIAGVAAMCLLAGGSFASAQTAQGSGSGERLTAADMSAITDARVGVVKAALQLTPEQMKFWPAVEDAIRSRAMARHLRLAELASRMNGQTEEVNPIKLMRDRADALGQRAAGLKKLADAWQPLYETLSPDQKRRMAILTVRVLRDVRDRIQNGRPQDEEEDSDE